MWPWWLLLPHVAHRDIYSWWSSPALTGRPCAWRQTTDRLTSTETNEIFDWAPVGERDSSVKETGRGGGGGDPGQGSIVAGHKLSVPRPAQRPAWRRLSRRTEPGHRRSIANYADCDCDWTAETVADRPPSDKQTSDAQAEWAQLCRGIRQTPRLILLQDRRPLLHALLSMLLHTQLKQHTTDQRMLRNDLATVSRKWRKKQNATMEAVKQP